MENITSESLRKAELRRLDAETARLNAEAQKYELESKEMEKRVHQPWFHGRYFIQSIVAGVVAAGLVASWFVKDLPVILGTQAEVQKIENELLSKKNDQRSIELKEQNKLLQQRVEAQKIQLKEAEAATEKIKGDLKKAEVESVKLKNQLANFAEQIEQLETQQGNDAAKTRIVELANITREATKNVTSQIEQLQTQQIAAKTSLDSLDLQKKQLDNYRYIVGFYSFNASYQSHDDVANYLSDEGYTVRNSTKLNSRTSWLAHQSTILYYAKESMTKAEEIAAKLGEITKSKFQVKQGAGLGVRKGDEKWTFFIHYIGT